MLYLSGKESRVRGVGMLVTPQGRKNDAAVRRSPVWAADTGCFRNPDAFDLADYCDWLRSLDSERERCLFVTLPDVVGDASATLLRSKGALSAVKTTGYPIAYVAQDGQERLPVLWDEIRCLFLGGTTHWKLGPDAAALVAEAKRRGKWAHMGRVNSLRRLYYARHIGCDSADGTFLAFGPDTNRVRMRRWFDALAAQEHLL